MGVSSETMKKVYDSVNEDGCVGHVEVIRTGVSVDVTKATDKIHKAIVVGSTVSWDELSDETLIAAADRVKKDYHDRLMSAMMSLTTGDFGYHPGDEYLVRCRTCREQFTGSRNARVCEDCAQSALDAYRGEYM